MEFMIGHPVGNQGDFDRAAMQDPVEYRRMLGNLDVKPSGGIVGNQPESGALG
jgi:hypothetical protein